MSRHPSTYRLLDQLFVSELELLSQAYTRLRANGAISFSYSFQDFLDIIGVSGQFTDTEVDLKY